MKAARLRLNRETLRNLSERSLSKAGGGGAAIFTGTRPACFVQQLSLQESCALVQACYTTTTHTG